jgi:beta-lactam-binding protein with PASTA domain
MALRTRVWSAGKILVLVGALVATYVLFAAASMRWALRAREVQVPDLTNKTAVEATATMSSLGLTLKVDDSRRIDTKVAAGRVMSQDPPPQTTTRQQRTVRVWLSAGAHATLVPALEGQTERAAELRLAQDGLQVGSIAEIRSESAAADVVVAQDPPANSTGLKVALLVNRAEQASNYVMPDLIGVNGERASTILRDQGFRVAVVGSTPYPGVSAGIVLRQSPQAGFQIAPGEPISIEVSR